VTIINHALIATFEILVGIVKEGIIDHQESNLLGEVIDEVSLCELTILELIVFKLQYCV